MDEDSRTAEIYQTVQEVTHRFVRASGICGLAIVASLGLAGRVRACCCSAYHHLALSGAFFVD